MSLNEALLLEFRFEQSELGDKSVIRVNARSFRCYKEVSLVESDFLCVHHVGDDSRGRTRNPALTVHVNFLSTLNNFLYAVNAFDKVLFQILRRIVYNFHNFILKMIWEHGFHMRTNS